MGVLYFFSFFLTIKNFAASAALISFKCDSLGELAGVVTADVSAAASSQFGDGAKGRELPLLSPFQKIREGKKRQSLTARGTINS